jgi:hypothetical protein
MALLLTYEYVGSNVCTQACMHISISPERFAAMHQVDKGHFTFVIILQRLGAGPGTSNFYVNFSPSIKISCRG